MKKTTSKSTPYGPVVIIWKGCGSNAAIIRVLLSGPDASAVQKVAQFYPGTQDACCAKIDSVSLAICRFLEGEPVDFDLYVADLSVCKEFQQRVLRAEHSIGRGHVSTYKLIAIHLGVPLGARAVGNALAKNPFPLIVPCHRAIRSDCGIGGYQGGADMKRSLLSKEGIAFDSYGRVKCSRFHYGWKDWTEQS